MDVPPNLLFRKIVIDRPFTIILFRTKGIDRPFAILSIVSDERYRHVDLSPIYCFSVGEQRRSKTAHIGTINFSLPFIIHGAHPSSPAENPRIRHCLSLLCPKKLKVDGLNKVVTTIYVCSMRSSSQQCSKATCLCAVQFLLTPYRIPVGYWANNSSSSSSSSIVPAKVSTKYVVARTESRACVVSRCGTLLMMVRIEI